jgi:hypothetical protein
MMYNRQDITNFINTYDINSLDNLSKIKQGQTVDIYTNGTVSEPYDSSTWSSSIWRTSRWIGGVSKNREDIPLIRALMQRALTGYLNGGDSIKQYLDGALEGLNNLKNHYKMSNKTEASDEIDKIMEFTQKNLVHPVF